MNSESEVIDVSSSSSQDFEDSRDVFGGDEEATYSNDSNRVNLRPLVPADVEDELAGSVNFIDTFLFRYGTNCPPFFSGTLQDALREACMRPVAERRLLAVYLHHEESVLSNIFCSEVLCFDSIVQTLSANFVVWGWDVTSDGAREMFCNSISDIVGSSVVDTLSKFSIDSYPLVILLTRPRRDVEMSSIISGNNSVNEVFSSLINAVEFFTQIQQSEIKNEEERCLRENIKVEQDRAYEASLLADRAKEEAKRQHESLLQKEEQQMKRQKEEEEARREAERKTVFQSLPAEPKEGIPAIQARFRTPDGQILHRRFNPNDTLKILFDYLLVEGYRTKEYKVIAGWPRKDLTGLDGMMSLIDLKIPSQETFILEER